jgi:ABC-type uncharacterized transport system ATPase subunit
VAGNGQNELMEIFLNENNDNFKGDIIFKNKKINQLSTQDRNVFQFLMLLNKD